MKLILNSNSVWSIKQVQIFLDFYSSKIVNFKDFVPLRMNLSPSNELKLLLPHHHHSNASWVDIMRWLRICQQRESKSAPEKSKMKLTEFGQRAESKKQERAPPAVQRKRQQKVSNIHTQSKHQTSSNTEWDTLISLAPQEASIFRKSSKCKLI